MPKVVMVDDDQTLLEMVQAFLTASGWTFFGARDGASGLEMIARKKPDLILCDVNLPDTTGFEICSKLKKNEATRDTPLILISGEQKEAQDILKGLIDLGADDYILKPVHLDVLKTKIEKLRRTMPSVVMVDDDRTLLEVVGSFLTHAGWTFFGARDGASGLELIAREKPDLILCDVNLPDTNGFEICSKLKKDEATRDIPLMLISGERKEAEAVLNGLVDRGADDYIIKPVHLDVLKAKIEALLKTSAKG